MYHSFAVIMHAHILKTFSPEFTLQFHLVLRCDSQVARNSIRVPQIKIEEIFFNFNLWYSKW